MERVGEGAAFRECQDQDQIPKRRHESGRLGLYIVALSERRAGGGEAGVRGEKKKRKRKMAGPGRRRQKNSVQ